MLLTVTLLSWQGAERRCRAWGFCSTAEHKEGLAVALMPPGPEAAPGRCENK